MNDAPSADAALKNHSKTPVPPVASAPSETAPTAAIVTEENDNPKAK